jgi:GDP-fucose transporter C1
MLLAAGIVTLGFFLGVVPSSSLPKTSAPSLLSLFYGFLSSLFIAIHAVLIKTSLPYCHDSTIQLAYWTNAGSAALLIPFVWIHGEPGKFQALVHSETWHGDVFFWGCIVTGVFGFLLCVAGLLSIKITSPITHMFSSVSLAHVPDVLPDHYPGCTIRASNITWGVDIQRYIDRVRDEHEHLTIRFI